MILESFGDLLLVFGVMCSYLYIELEVDFFCKCIVQVCVVIWEWEFCFGCGFWGDSKGILVGFIVVEMKCDGCGVVIKMLIGGGENFEGVNVYEIKFVDKKEIYK